MNKKQNTKVLLTILALTLMMGCTEDKGMYGSDQEILKEIKEELEIIKYDIGEIREVIGKPVTPEKAGKPVKTEKEAAKPKEEVKDKEEVKPVEVEKDNKVPVDEVKEDTESEEGEEEVRELNMYRFKRGLEGIGYEFEVIEGRVPRRTEYRWGEEQKERQGKKEITYILEPIGAAVTKTLVASKIEVPDGGIMERQQGEMVGIEYFINTYKIDKEVMEQDYRAGIEAVQGEGVRRYSYGYQLYGEVYMIVTIQKKPGENYIRYQIQETGEDNLTRIQKEKGTKVDMAYFEENKYYPYLTMTHMGAYIREDGESKIEYIIQDTKELKQTLRIESNQTETEEIKNQSDKLMVVFQEVYSIKKGKEYDYIKEAVNEQISRLNEERETQSGDEKRYYVYKTEITTPTMELESIITLTNIEGIGWVYRLSLADIKEVDDGVYITETE